MNSYYVAVNGNDNNQGSLDSPFATLSHAINVIGPGDTIYVREGSYEQNRSLWLGEQHSGYPNKHTVIQSFPGEKVILNAKNQISGNLIDIEGDYIDIIGFEMTNSPRHGIGIWGGDHIQIKNNVIHETQNGGIIAHGVENNDREDRVSHLHIEGNTVYRTNLANQSRVMTSGWDSGINASRADHATIQKNTVYNNYGEGISLTLSSNSVIADNRTYDNFSVEIYLDNARDSIIERNFSHNTGNIDFFRKICGAQCEWLPSVGIQFANEDHGSSEYLLNNNIIRNNIIVGARNSLAYGNYQTRRGITNTLVINNTFYGARTNTLHIDADENTQNISFINNIFDPGNNTLTFYIPKQEGLSFQRNLFNYTSIQGLSANATSSSPSDNIIANPSFLNPGGTDAMDYGLLSNSKAIDAGLISESILTDFFNTNRLSGRSIDIGAVEVHFSHINQNGTAKDDLIKGGKDHDILHGQKGNDTLHGYRGNDSLIGAQGNDILHGQKGDDQLTGNIGDDKLKGGDGSDTLIGGRGADILVGANSLIQSHDSVDILTGGSGKDRFVIGNKAGVFYQTDHQQVIAGVEDYAQITDFNKRYDSIQLNGSSRQYTLQDVSPISSTPGKSLYFDHNSNGFDATDDLVAIIQTPQALSLSASYFTYI